MNAVSRMSLPNWLMSAAYKIFIQAKYSYYYYQMLHHLKDVYLCITCKGGQTVRHSCPPHHHHHHHHDHHVLSLLWGWSPGHAHHIAVWLLNADPKKSRRLNTNSRIIPCLR